MHAASLPFTKMHGAGNDFVVLDARGAGTPPDAALARAMGDRHTGIGCDQLLVIVAPCDPACRAGYRIFNRDGSPAEQCGNGARCVAAWLHRHGNVTVGETFALDGPTGRVTAELLTADEVRVAMGEPAFGAAAVGCTPAADDAADGPLTLAVADAPVHLRAVSMGNPHAVIEVTSMDDPALTALGPAITHHRRFAHGVNAGFAKVLGRHRITLRVHERGAGWTLACGSGACAAAAAMIASGRCASPVEVELPGGTLTIDWAGPGQPLWMRGPAAFVFEGVWPLS